MRKIMLIAAVLLLGLTAQVKAQSPADAAAIKQTALDYIEGWYEGDAERMERALHPGIGKTNCAYERRRNESA